MLGICVVHETVRDVGRQSWRFPLRFFSIWNFSCSSLLRGKFLQVQDFASLHQKDKFCHRCAYNPSCHPNCTWLETKSCESELAWLCSSWHVTFYQSLLLFTLQCLQGSDFYRVHTFSAETWSDMLLSHYKKQKSWPVRMKRLKEISDQKDLKIEFSSVSHLVMSGSLRPHELQHTRPPRPSSTPGVYSSSCLSSRWCHLTTSSSVIPFSSQPQSFPASGSFQMSQFFASAGQTIGVSASASVLPINIQDWFPLQIDLLDLLAVQGTLKSLLQHHSLKASILWRSAFFVVQLSHPYMTTGKKHNFD